MLLNEYLLSNHILSRSTENTFYFWRNRMLHLSENVLISIPSMVRHGSPSYSTYTHFFQFANEILLWLWNVFLLLCGLVTRCVTMRNNTCYWNNAWRQNNKPGLLLKIINMNFPMGFILDGALSKRHLKMVLKIKIVERCVEKLPQRKRNPSKCRSEQLSGIIYFFVHMPANLNEHIFQTDICS